jgi:hypothetical protein
VTTNLLDCIDSLPLASRWAIDCFSAPDDGVVVAQSIRDGTAVAISDGSYKDNFGTTALTIEPDIPTLNNCVLATNAVPEQPEHQSSYRSELSGLWGIVTMIQCLCDKYGIIWGSYSGL